jgi:hypothetical protein
MKVRPIYLLLIVNLLFLLRTNCNAQQSGFELEFGIGSYNMSNLKELNGYIQQNLGFHTEVTADFPIYPYFKASAFMNVKGNQVGLAFSFYSTGSRVSASDYSGDYRFENLLNAYVPGIFISTPFTQKGKLGIEGRLEGGAIFTKMENNEYFKLYDTVYINSTNKFKSVNAYLEPGLKLRYPVYHFICGIYAGYMIQFGKQGFYVDNRKNSQVLNPATQSVLKPGWDGFRISISLAYPL